MKTYLIYKAENITNGKCYVGRTSSTLERRRSWHYSNANKKNATGKYIFNNLFFTALRKYEKSCFSWDILESGLNKEIAYKREAFYIQKFNCVENGYNQKESDLIPWNKNKKMNEEYCRRLQGMGNGMYGKTHSAEYKKWRSEHMSKSQYGGNNPTARKVKCIETGKIWNSIVECSKDTGIESDNIAACCNPKRRNKTAGGYTFIYIDKKTPKRNVDVSGGKNPMAKHVRCIETGQIWSSAIECAKEFGVSQSAISVACRLKTRRCKGYHFEYL